MRFICFYLFLVVLAFEGNVLAQTLQAPQATIQSRIYIPSDAEFQKMTAEEQRAFQSAGLMLHLSVKKEPAVAKTENKDRGNLGAASQNQAMKAKGRTNLSPLGKTTPKGKNMSGAIKKNPSVNKGMSTGSKNKTQ